MSIPGVDSLKELHTAFWRRELDEPVVNVDCSICRRFDHVPWLPPEWRNNDGLILTADSLSPERFQPEPISVDKEHPAFNEVAFNVLFPYHRVPWLVGIMGCGMHISTSSETVWPISYMSSDWHQLENLGFTPRLEWLDKLLEFTRYIVDNYYPDRCIPGQDTIGRGPGDLLIAVLGPEMAYLEMHDHPEEVKSLLNQIADLYIRWAQAQLDVIPQIDGGYCNQYGIWCPGKAVRFQEDYAMNLSDEVFDEFLMPIEKRIVDAFEYGIIHTHSGCPKLARRMLEVDDLKAIEVVLDPVGPSLEELVPLWDMILERKCLIISGYLSQSDLDMLRSRLSPQGLWFDVEIVGNGV